MAFDPLETDVPYDGPPLKKNDMDRQMLMGCSGFLFTCITSFTLGVWPFFMFQDISTTNLLITAVAAAFVPALIIACFGALRFGVSGTAGAIGASLCVGIFLFLRLQQAFLAGMAQTAPTPDYPKELVYFLPLLYILIIAAISSLLTKPERGDEEPEPSRKQK